MSSHDQSENLTADDHLVENTVKDSPDTSDADLSTPDQDPAVILTSVVDENGNPT